MATVLTVAGSAVSRPGARVVLRRLRRSVDGHGEAEFVEIGPKINPGYHPGQSVDIDVDSGACRFRGQVVRHDRQPGRDGYVHHYHCLGLEYLADTIALTNANNSTGFYTLNLPADDPDYNASLAGQSVGNILTTLFTDHAASLSAVGVAGFVAGDLAALTVVPPRPVYLSGSRLLSVARQLLSEWYPRHACWVEYQSGTADWRLVVKDTGDTAVFVPATLTLGTDPVEPPAVTRDTGDCSTRVVVRGRAEVEGWYASTALGTLTRTWSSGDQSAWKWDDFVNPAGGVDSGAITALTSTTATCDPDDNTRTWAANFWSGIQAFISLINPLATDIMQQEVRRVTANASLAAAGTSVVTLDRALVNSGYTKYRLVGQPQGKSRVWREYKFTDSTGATVVTAVGQHLQRKFPYPVPFATADMAVLTSYPMFMVKFGSTMFPWPAEVDVANGFIRFVEPTAKEGNTQTNLNTGGASVTAPDDVIVFVPYSRGTLQAVYPADVAGVAQYSGTAYAADGIQRTLYIDVPEWIDKRDQANQDALAQVLQPAVRDSVVTGSAVYHGKYATGLTLGISLNIAANYGSAYTTGLESINAAVREFTLHWPESGPDNWLTELSFSTRRLPARGDGLYRPRPWAGAGYEGLHAGFDGALVGGLGVGWHDGGGDYGDGDGGLPDLSGFQAGRPGEGSTHMAGPTPTDDQLASLHGLGAWGSTHMAGPTPTDDQLIRGNVGVPPPLGLDALADLERQAPGPGIGGLDGAGGG